MSGWVFGILGAFALLSIVAYIVLYFYIRKRTSKVRIVRVSSHGSNKQGAPVKEPGRIESRYTTVEARDGNTTQPLVDDEDEDKDKLVYLPNNLGNLIDDHKILSYKWLTIGEKIGKGQYGIVFKGIFKDPDSPHIRKAVAIKTISNFQSQQDADEFIKEADIMSSFNHPNVLPLIGVCFNEQDLPLILTPFMVNGALHSYLRNEINQPTNGQLIEFAQQIAKGMDYLHFVHNFAHRDLAARNCMLDENMNVKVSDFGLTRFLDQYSHNYHSRNNMQLPIRWMAPESIERGVYNEKTDVWAFGVTLWEILTRGLHPYSTIPNDSIFAYITGGNRLPEFESFPAGTYKLMQNTWKRDNKYRPTFKEIIMELEEIVARAVTNERNLELTHPQTDRTLFENVQAMFADRNLLIASGCIKIEKDLYRTSLNPAICLATLQKENQPIRKVMVKVPVNQSEANEIVQEALALKELNHENILRLIGVYISEELPITVYPFMSNGNLLDYIRDSSREFLLVQLIEFAIGIGHGLEYLHKKNFIPRNLRARSCMLDKDLRVKICSIELGKDVYEKDDYKSNSRVSRIDVKRMAPETISEGLFDEKSSVWTFGICLWEILCRGEEPFAHIKAHRLSAQLKSGLRLPKLDHCPKELCDVIDSCMHFEPSKRPLLSTIINRIETVTKTRNQNQNVIHRAVYYNVNPGHSKRATDL